MALVSSGCEDGLSFHFVARRRVALDAEDSAVLFECGVVNFKSRCLFGAALVRGGVYADDELFEPAGSHCGNIDGR